MSVYDLNRDKNDILLRGVIVALLSEFGKKISFTQTRGGEDQTVDVPFFFGFGNSERYLQDLFLNEYKSTDEGRAEGVYNQVPRGILKVQNVEVLSDELTNNYVRVSYKKEVDGELLTYTANAVRVPLSIPCQVDIHVNSVTEQFKVIQAILDHLWKQGDFKVDVNNVKVPGRYVIEDDFERERQMDFSYDNVDNTVPSLGFSLTVYAEYPVFKGDTEMFAGKNIQEIQRSLTIDRFDTEPEAERGPRANYDDVSKLRGDPKKTRQEGEQKDLKVGGGSPRTRGRRDHADDKWKDVWPNEGGPEPPQED